MINFVHEAHTYFGTTWYIAVIVLDVFIPILAQFLNAYMDKYATSSVENSIVHVTVKTLFKYDLFQNIHHFICN